MLGRSDLPNHILVKPFCPEGRVQGAQERGAGRHLKCRNGVWSTGPQLGQSGWKPRRLDWMTESFLSHVARLGVSGVALVAPPRLSEPVVPPGAPVVEGRSSVFLLCCLVTGLAGQNSGRVSSSRQRREEGTRGEASQRVPRDSHGPPVGAAHLDPHAPNPLLSWAVFVGCGRLQGALLVTPKPRGGRCLRDCRVTVKGALVQVPCGLLPVGGWAGGKALSPAPQLHTDLHMCPHTQGCLPRKEAGLESAMSSVEQPVSEDTHRVALSLSSEPAQGSDASWAAVQHAVLPCPATGRAWSGRPGHRSLAGSGWGSMDTGHQGTLGHWLHFPTCSFNRLARDRPVAEVSHAGLG